MKRRLCDVCLILGLANLISVISSISAASPQPHGPSVRDYPSVQAAIDANPGLMVYVPPGDFVISEALRISRSGSGLFGPGRILQADAKRAILVIDHAEGVRISDLTLTRKAEAMETQEAGVIAIGCRDLTLDQLKVLDNRTRSSAIEIRECVNSAIRNCLVRNYHCVSIDDRTAGPHYGYAFRCMIGTGLMVRESRGTLIQGNRFVEENLIPTPEMMRKLELGKFVKKTKKGPLISQQAWDRGFTENWMQGSAIVVTSPEQTDLTQIIGNYVENTGQGIDIHADRVIVSQNIVQDTLIGMKAMHGSRNVIITGNQFSKSSLWSIGLMPGISAHPAIPATASTKERAANVDGGSIIANNIISDFGLGRTNWIWGNGDVTDNGYPLRFDRGQEADDPPLSDVLIQGNVVYDSGKAGVVVDGKVKTPGPRYKYSVLVEQGPGDPQGLHFSGNLFHPGTRGISNVDLRP